MSATAELSRYGEFRLDTRSAPPQRRLMMWREVVSDILPMRTEGPEGLAASVHVRSIGAMLAAEVESGGGLVERRECDIAYREAGACYVFEQVEDSGSIFETPGRQSGAVAVGDIVLGDADAPMTSLTRTTFHHRFWLVPRTLLGDTASQLAGGVHIRRSAPMGRLLASYLEELRKEAPHLECAEREACASVAGELIALAAGRADPREAPVARRGQLAMVRRAIAQRLTDPLLTPHKIASQCGMSVRKLHALFEPTGVSFSAYLTQRRLKIARKQLLAGAPTVAETAFAVGFNSLATFYRVYKSAYGEAPGDTRERDRDH